MNRYNSCDAWDRLTEERLECCRCGEDKGGIFFSAEEPLCLKCVVREMAGMVRDEMTGPEAGTALSEQLFPDFPPARKIGLLWEMEKLIALGKNSCPETLEKIALGIILNLGYNSEHPLSYFVRALTVDQLMTHGEPLLPFLREATRWRLPPHENLETLFLEYNLSKVLALLAPRTAETQGFIDIQIQTARTRGDRFITRWFSLGDEGYRLSYEPAPGAVRLEKLFEHARLKIRKKEDPETQGDPLLTQAVQILDSGFTLAELKVITETFLYPLRFREGIGIAAPVPPKNGRKSRYLKDYAEILVNPEAAERLLESLPEWLKASLEQAVLEDRTFSLQELGERSGTHLPEERRYNPHRFRTRQASLRPDGCLLQFHEDTDGYYHRESRFYYLDEAVAGLFRRAFFASRPCRWTPKDRPASGLLTTGNDDILSQLPLLLSFAEQIGIKRSKNNGNILKSPLTEFRKLTTPAEPYSGPKELKTLRTEQLLHIGDKYRELRPDPAASPRKLLEDLFTRFFAPAGDVRLDLSFLSGHLKFQNRPQFTEGEEVLYGRVRLSVETLLKELPPGKWVEIEEIYKVLNIRRCLPVPFHLETVRGQVYITSRGESEYGSYDERIYLDYRNRREIVNLPFLKGLLFCLNTLGLLDMAYEDPVNPRFNNKGRPWLSVYDGVREISLTKLGAYLAGRRGFPGEEATGKTVSPPVLDEKRLLITLDEENSLLEMTLKQMARPLAPRCYRVTPEVFLRNCEGSEDIAAKIASFRTYVCADPPEIWESFFGALIENADPLEQQGTDHLLFRLKSEDKALAKILLGDPGLRGGLLKAEDYHFFIRRSAYPRMKKAGRIRLSSPPKEKLR